MPEYKIEMYDFSNEGTRNDVRMRLIEKFSKEQPGTGNEGEASRYTYYVEKLNNGNRIYLRRPANLHNGFDFLVCVEGVNYAEPGKKMRNFPKHSDIENDLKEKQRENPEEYKKLYTLLRKVFLCQNVTDDMIDEIKFSSGFTPEHLIKVVKWLFIEQDIRYWNYSGRNMTWGVIPPIE